jgi:DNA-binding transcriptional LysR family regulator
MTLRTDRVAKDMAGKTETITRRVDLNLLHVLHAIMAEGGVTRAARRLSMTQPAVSNALRRARIVFRDELFVKTSTGIRPTERALALWPDLHEGLSKLGNLVESPNFRPASTTLTFRMAITESLLAVAEPMVTMRFLAAAPHARLHFLTHTNEISIENLNQGRLDCAVGMFPNPPDTLQMRGLLRDEYVCVMRKDHPALADWGLEAFMACRHISVKQHPHTSSFVDVWLELAGRSRPIAATMVRFESAIAMAAQTDYLTAIPRRLAERCGGADIAIRPLPFQAQPLLYKMLWHERSDKSPARIWFRDLVASAVQEAVGSVPEALGSRRKLRRGAASG